MKNIAGFSAYKNAEAFVGKFTVSDALYTELENFAAKDSINIRNLSPKDKQFLQKRVKSLLARQIWRTDGFYEVINASDPVILKAEETIH